MMMLIIVFSIFFVPTVEQKVGQDCPDHQVLHVDPDTKLAFCCMPVKLSRGHEFVRCPINGTYDSTRKCPEGLFQVDETITSSEATCTSEPQCITKENLIVYKCDEKNENCIPTCVCNYPGEFCGTVYYDCRPFPTDCAKEYVQEDCSCNEPVANGSGADTAKMPVSDVASTKNSTMSDPIIPFKPTDGKPIINIKNDTVLTDGKKNNTFEKDNTSRPELEQKKSGFPVYLVVVIVVGAIVFAIAVVFVVCYRVCLGEKLLCICKKCQRCGQNPDYITVPPDEVVPPDVVVTNSKPPIVMPGKPTVEVKPLIQGLAQEDNGVQSFNVCDEPGDAQDAHIVNVECLLLEPIPSTSSNFGIEELINGCVTLSTISSTSFDNENTLAKQNIGSDQNNDNTGVKQVEDTDQTERKELELNQHHSVEENHQSETTGLPSVVSRFQSGSSGWSSFGSSVNNSGQIVEHPHGDFDIQEQELGNEDNQEDSQETGNKKNHYS
ncbi:hypothetical protein CHS0354_016848 [Potamilus streckersoni]|uniref:Chitin-binding type-2 domain-containing protein n=1 Tax=Potamilus streckersoni TaxID=2493646 RepID=A0AAE0SVD4_9BIVA|nr:hypothetical protein CHS0354_016848 [Potamilus streckersoni]